MKNILILDCETTGVDRERDSVIEIGAVLWSIEHRTIIETYSRLLPAEQNAAEAINGIPGALLQTLGGSHEEAAAWTDLGHLAAEADAIAAHQADFDRSFCDRHASADRPMGLALTDRPWICTREDMTWPRMGGGESLIAIALAHGVAVVAAHRAINDCLLLARLFEAVPDIDVRLEAALVHAQLPKVRLVSLAPFEEKDIVKSHGFKWDPARREWWRVMAEQDATGLPFRTRAVAL